MTKELRDSQVIKKSGVSLKCPGYIFVRHRI
uniref:Uncharacterized protein n=1 Tax=Lepeophtheirus salmonis TaxID=72036 RepID=A0A0K2VIS1_LEPSM